jgi:hypothetical protein
MINILQTSSILRYAAYSSPILLTGGIGYLYYDRKKKLEHPIVKRTLKVLESDKRVIDFCGNKIKPGILVKKKVDKEGTVTYKFNISGSSGKLKTDVTADFALHSSLKIFNEELEEHTQKKEAKESGYDVVDFEDNWPIDLEEYDMPDFDTYLKFKNFDQFEDIKKKSISSEEKVWRIKKLRVAVDQDTRILLLPLPESKRDHKLIDTRYYLNTYNDLFERYASHENKLIKAEEGSYKRHEDKTSEEIEDDIRHKRRRQFQQMNKIRKYQFIGIFGCLFFYLVAWNRIKPKPVLGSLIYNQSLDIIKKSNFVKNKLGENFQVMSCHGRIYPLLTNVVFDLVIHGEKGQAKFRVNSNYQNEKSLWLVEDIFMLPRDDMKTYKL